MSPERSGREGFRRLLRAGLIRRGPRTRPRAEGELRAMAMMARKSWLRALRTGEVEPVPGGFIWRPERRRT